MDKMNWIRQYNDLFEKINQQGSPSYFSGPRFLSVIREFDESFADYQQYINYRNEKGLSTSRKVFFFDILSMFKEEIREAIIARIYEIIDKSTVAKETKEVELAEEESATAKAIELKETPTSNEIIENPIVFISYSWDNEDHKSWVMNLAQRLISNGIEVLLDRYDLKGGSNAPVFMEAALKKANKVLVIFTPNYKLKADKRQGGVGVEYSILNNDIYKNIAENSKYIPVLRSGTFQTSIPDFIQQFIAVDMTVDSQYEEKIRELTLIIYDKPAIARPAIGKKPDYI